MGTNKQSPEKMYSLYSTTVYWDSRIVSTDRSLPDVFQLIGFDCINIYIFE